MKRLWYWINLIFWGLVTFAVAVLMLAMGIIFIFYGGHLD